MNNEECEGGRRGSLRASPAQKYPIFLALGVWVCYNEGKTEENEVSYMKYKVSDLSLDEKLRLLTGVGMWRTDTANGKLPAAFLADGPNGLRMMDDSVTPATTYPATAMPNPSLLANTFNPSLAYLDGETIADECILRGADVLLAPGVNIKRTPLSGRNFEYFSEDPYLSGMMARAFIEGVQSRGIGTSLKHFCANNREYDRLLQTSEVDERTLREIYFPAFEIALKAKPYTVMCAYNPVNGVYASENKWLLRDVLRGEFGYDGLIVSDWDATQNPVRAIKASLDLIMPERLGYVDMMKKAYEEGRLTDEEIDTAVGRILALLEKTEKKGTVTTTAEERHERAVRIAREGMVLLKNEGGILPLKAGRILVAGSFKDTPPLGGGGAAYVTTEYKGAPLNALLSERLGDGATVTASRTSVGPERALWLKDTYEKAYRADVAVLCVGTDKTVEGEGFDRTSLRLSRVQEDLILETAKVNKNVVVVLYAGAPVDMSPWIDKVRAVLLAGYAGEGAQEAVADLLAGVISPSGKLSETYPLSLEDTPTGEARGNGFVERYSEGVFVGYRYYDEMEKEVLFPFGHGLSYAEFEYSDLAIERTSETDCKVSFTVKNLSDIPAKEVVQLYVRDVFSMVSRPPKELKGFHKVSLAPGEEKRVTLTLDERAFAYYSLPEKGWLIENGDFEILVGASSRDIRLSETIRIKLPDTPSTTLCW